MVIVERDANFRNRQINKNRRISFAGFVGVGDEVRGVESGRNNAVSGVFGLVTRNTV